MSDFGEFKRTARGFGMVEFEDAYGDGCSMQCNSAVGNYEDSFERAGTSFLWIGIDDPDPKVMCIHAESCGVEPEETHGWQKYPIPERVQINTRMHLNREQVAGLIGRLQEWLDNGKFDKSEVTP